MPVQLLPIRQSAELQRRKLNEGLVALNDQEERNTQVGASLPVAVPADGVLFVVEGPPAELHVAISGSWVQLV